MLMAANHLSNCPELSYILDSCSLYLFQVSYIGSARLCSSVVEVKKNSFSFGLVK